jgi:hypothetical protein
MTSIVVSQQLSKVIVVQETTPKIIVVYKGMDAVSSGTVGDLLSTNNLSDVANIDISRNNLKAINKEESIINSLIFG